MKKYRLGSKAKVLGCGTVVHEIIALRDIPKYSVSKGDIGGFVESEANLSQLLDDDSWIKDDAIAKGHTRMEKGALLLHRAVVTDSLISGEIIIGADAQVSDSELRGNQMEIMEYAQLTDVQLEGELVEIRGNVTLNMIHSAGLVENFFAGGMVNVDGSEVLFLKGENIKLEGNVVIEEGGRIVGEDIHLSGHADLVGGVSLTGQNIKIDGFAHLVGDVRLGDNCTITDMVEVWENDISFDPLLKGLHLTGEIITNTGELFKKQEQMKSR